MCTNPLNIRNNSEYLDYGSRLNFDVPCCHCKECIDAKVRGYLLRNFLQYKLICETCGYAYFDTLTYNNECVPRTDGQMHFDSRHVKNFMKRLRISILRKYGIKRDAFKFFLVCEFGGQKFRPHYHVLFYVLADIPLMEFKRLINAAWWYGFTDSYYMTKKHVLTSCAAIRYLVKYLSKYADFDKWKDEYIKEHLDSPLCDMSKEELRRFRPFLRLSNNLGYTDNIDLLACDTIQIPNKSGYDLFCYSDYYKRKQLYEKIPLFRLSDGTLVYKKTAGGSYQYRLSAKGVEYKKKHYSDMLKSVTEKYRQLYQLMPTYMKNEVDFFLNGRSLRDVALFNVVFYYKLFDLSFLRRSRALADSWESFCFEVYSDSLQISVRPFDSDFFVQVFHDREFPETQNMYHICTLFNLVNHHRAEYKHEVDKEKLDVQYRLGNLKLETPVSFNSL